MLRGSASPAGARQLGRFAATRFERDWRARTGDQRPLPLAVEMVTWVTPLLKAYNQPDAQLARVTEAPPFAGLRIAGIYTSPRAIGMTVLLAGFLTSSYLVLYALMRLEGVEGR